MSDTLDLIARQRATLRELLSGAAERAKAEEAAAERYYSRIDAAEEAFAKETKALAARQEAEKEAAKREHTEARAATLQQFTAERTAARAEFAKARNTLRERLKIVLTTARNALQEELWTSESLLEASKTEAETHLRGQQERVAQKQTKLEALQRDAQQVLRSWNQPEDYLERIVHSGSDILPGLEQKKLSQCLSEAEEILNNLYDLVILRYMQKRQLTIFFLLLWLSLILPAGWLTLRFFSQPNDIITVFMAGVPIGFAIAGFLFVIGYAILNRMVITQVQQMAQPLAICFHIARGRIRHLMTSLSARAGRQIRISRTRYERTARRIKERFQKERDEVSRQRREEYPLIKSRCLTRRSAAVRRRAEDLRQAKQRFAEQSAALEAYFTAEFSRQTEQLERERTEARADYEAAAAVYGSAWRDVLTRLAEVNAEVRTVADTLFPPWEGSIWQDRPSPTAIPPVLRFGTVHVRRALVPHAVPADNTMSSLAPPEDLALPALMPFPAGASLLLHARNNGRPQAVAVIQAMMFRLLTAMPPGKVRFTILDSAGLGQNFAGFMHLADYEATLIGSRIWTEPGQIDQKLADLTVHMETVIQKYLRDRFATLAEYNVQAAEVAEPYQVVVVANFPAGFSDEAARRLASLSTNGPRCGVHVLVSTDDELPLPHGFDYSDLKATVHLTWNGERFRWEDDDFRPFPLETEALPPPELANNLLEQIGRAAKLARRVEVPFEYIAPSPEQWWTGDSSNGLNVALGRAAIGGKQFLALGHGTSQHVMIAGKTGSGKSTLLHALITNAALIYGPDEVELYLIDFKKGVEFKTYAAHGLPHARVVAIESEREFGLSVLQRLDSELRHRGELFRDAGTQDLPSYRRSGHSMPRVLLVVDEFQEFFVEDDRLAQDAAGLLDRLVRQGRAFGLHVLLGSQTLGGAFSLARSTIDQMAIRIALQCSETDAQLILSMDNAAAKLLTRPGEAIYNDANGLAEGNHLFQVVWLNESRREEYLNKLRKRAPERISEPMIVFEGNAPADVSRNAPLAALLNGEFSLVDERLGRQAWLGESMSLGDPAAVNFRRQSGSNLAIVGQQDDTALGMMATALVSLALPQPAAMLVIVDGGVTVPSETGILARLAKTLPCPVRLSGTRQLPDILAELSAEVTRRQTDSLEAPPIFLAIVGLHRCRDLRRAEDDYSFTRREDDAAVPPAQRLAELLREGPPVGVHVLMWCDTLNNLQRSLDRQALREVGVRVVMQMSISDSSTLIDNPLASRLGMHRALLASEEDGRMEKFRPYGLPTEAWLAGIKKKELRALEAVQEIRALEPMPEPAASGE